MKDTSTILPRQLGALLDEAEKHIEKCEFAQAEQLANEVFSQRNDKDVLPLCDEARALCILGECCSETSHYDEALIHYRNALAAAEQSSNLALQSYALNGTAIVQRENGGFNSVLGTARQALDLAQKAADKKQQAKSLNIIALVYEAIADHLHALDYHARALALLEELGDKHGISRTLVNIGSVYEMLGYYPRALDYHARALMLAEELGDKHGVARTLGSIGNAYEMLGNYHSALEYRARALAIVEETGQTQSVAINLGNMGLAYMKIGDYTRALEYLKRALDLSKQIGADAPAGFWMKGIAQVERKLGNLDAAHGGFLDMLHHQRDVLKSNEGLTETLRSLGGVLIEQGKTEDGLARLMESLTLAKELGEKNTTSEVHKEIADAYSKIGDMTNAHDHITKHLALDKEIFSEESTKRIETFNMRVAITDKELKAEVQKLRVEQLEQQLSSQATQLVSQIELLSKFRDEMREIVRQSASQDPTVRAIKEKLKELPCQSIDWEKFEQQFNEVHPEFRAKLSAKFPELTNMEQRIASMLRMDLKSSDIGRLFCITERAVEFHRLNLRKKLDLKQEESLPKFLRAI